MNLVKVLSVNWSSTSFEVPLGQRTLTPKEETHAMSRKQTRRSKPKKRNLEEMRDSAFPDVLAAEV